MARRSLFLVLGAAVVVTAAATAGACGGSSTGLGDGDDGGSGAGDDASTSGDDASTSGDGGTIDDGGSNIDPDAGDDGGLLPDGGKCNEIANTAAAIVSTCSSTLPTFSGGALVAGKYHLIAAEALGSAAFCKTSFLATGLKETLELTVSGTTGSVESVTEIAGGGPRHKSSTLTTNATNATPMQGQETCPSTETPASVPYSSGVVGGVQTMSLVLPYGKGTALYTYQKQP